MAKDKAKAEAEAAEAEAPEDGEGEAPAEEGRKKPSLKLLLIAGAGALVVLGGGGGAAFMLMAPKGDHPHKSKKPAHADGKKGEKGGPSAVSEGPDGVLFYTMPDLTVNMQASDGRPTFLKLKLAFELPDQDAVDAIAPNAPRLNDMFQTFLRELRPEDINGSQGSYQLRMELLRRVNLVIAPAKVNAVLIQEMLVQ